jgi:ribonuclease J
VNENYTSTDGVLRVVPLGGLGEIGKNMMLLEYETEHSLDSIIIDTGIMFPENDMLGIDLIIPDFNYIMDRLDTIRGVVVTHGHEDHTGAISHVMEHVRAPIYTAALTRGLLEVKLRGAGLLDRTTLMTVQAGDTVQMGPFTVEFFHVCHSIPDSMGVGVTTPVGLVVHTGDYKFDHTPLDGLPPDFGKLAEFSRRGVLALLADSTNADVAGWTTSESAIIPAFDEIFRNAPGRIIVATFASLISRIQLAADTAQRYGKYLAVTGYSMIQNVKMAREMGYLDIPDEILLDINQIQGVPEDQIVIMTTGTQGEPLAGVGRLSTGRHRHLEVHENDTILMSSHPIPGNEELVHRTINKLIQRGATVLYDPIKTVHVSGHASQEEMKLMINMVRPKFFVPIHGELRHLTLHARMAQELGIPEENIAVVENGTVLTFTPDCMEIGDRVPGGYVYIDGSGVGDIGPAVLRDREILGRDGFIIVNVRVDRDSRQVIGEPQFISRGFVYLKEARELLDDASDTVVSIISEDGRSSTRGIQQGVEKRLEKFFYNETKRRPMVFAFVNEM